VYDRDPEPIADQRQPLADVGRPVVEVERFRPAVLAQRPEQEPDHVDLTLARHGLESRKKARGIVEDPVDPQRLRRLAVDPRRTESRGLFDRVRE